MNRFRLLALKIVIELIIVSKLQLWAEIQNAITINMTNQLFALFKVFAQIIRYLSLIVHYFRKFNIVKARNKKIQIIIAPITAVDQPVQILSTLGEL